MRWIKSGTGARVKMFFRWQAGAMDSTRTTARDIRRRNRSTLLSTLFFQAPLSRLELSQATGLSAATVSNVTAELVEERLVVEAGQVESDGGRPRGLLPGGPRDGPVTRGGGGETGLPARLVGPAERGPAPRGGAPAPAPPPAGTAAPP